MIRERISEMMRRAGQTAAWPKVLGEENSSIWTPLSPSHNDIDTGQLVATLHIVRILDAFQWYADLCGVICGNVAVRRLKSDFTLFFLFDRTASQWLASSAFPGSCPLLILSSLGRRLRSGMHFQRRRRYDA